MNAPLDLIPLIRNACVDKKLREDARIIWRTIAKNLFEEKHRNGIRISDSGRCILELWSELHGKLDIEEDPDLQLTRFDIGTLYGARIACLTAAAIEAAHPDWDCVLEADVAVDGVPGHIDILVRMRDLDLTPLLVIEIKSTYWSGALDDPYIRAPYQVHQAVSYAEGKKAPWAVILTVGPAVHGSYSKALKAFVKPPKMRQDNYETHVHAPAAHREIARLKAALSPHPPEADAKEKWRCDSCRFSACERNKNPLNIMAVEP